MRQSYMGRLIAQRWDRGRRERKRPHWRHFCWYCGERTVIPRPGGWHDKRGRTQDHVQPVSRGGGHRANKVDCCARCNHSKADLTLDEFRALHGGGLFWGELFSPEIIEWTHQRPPDGREFRRWCDRQDTVGRDDWMDMAAAAESARGPRPLPASVQRLRWLAPPIRNLVWHRVCPCWWCRIVSRFTEPAP